MHRTILALVVLPLSFIPPALADLEAVREAQEAQIRAQTELETAERKLKEANAAAQELERVREFRRKRLELGSEANLKFQQYKRESGNNPLYERLQAIQRELVAGHEKERQLGVSGLSDTELEERTAALDEEAEQAAKEVDAARRELEGAEKAFDEAKNALDNSERIAFDATRRSDHVVDELVNDVFEALDDHFPGERDPSETRTIGFKIEKKIKIPVKGVNVNLGDKNMVFLSQTPNLDENGNLDGTYKYEVTVVGEGSLGASVGLAGTAEAGAAGVGQVRFSYEFDPEKSGDMVRMAALLAAAGAAGPAGAGVLAAAQELLDILPDELTAAAIDGMSEGISTVAKTGAKGAKVAGDLADMVGWDWGAETARAGGEALDRGAGFIENSTPEARDFAIAFKHLDKDPARNMTLERYQGGGQVDANLNIEKIAEFGGSVQVTWGKETSREGGEDVSKEIMQFQVKGNAGLGGTVGGEGSAFRQYIFKKIVDDDGNMSGGLEIVVQTAGEAGVGTGPMVPVVDAKGGVLTKTFTTYRVPTATEDQYNDLVAIFQGDLARADITGTDLQAELERMGATVEEREATGGYASLELDAKVVKVDGQVQVYNGDFHPDMVQDGDSD
ncbi:MAG: hypothetical protein HY720_08330 [Planctomycetes bacterium]|nr:hypothetical protein [Planctomycetota bacterium]